MFNCVCCENVSNGTYNNEFPVCYNCYYNGNLVELFFNLVNRNTIKLTESRDKYLDEINDAAEDWNEYRRLYEER